MSELLKKFEARTPEIVFEWYDQPTGARGWTVINSLRGGAAGGGTRMRVGLDRHEVESLAKTMEIKFTVAGPQIGGAKSGINFDPSDPRKQEVLQRWYKAVLPLLKAYYGTGGDLFVDEIHEVIPITSALGLLHPQEGVVNGHYGMPADRAERMKKLQDGVSLIVSDENYVPASTARYRIADMITGYGVAESVIHYYEQRNESVKGKRILIQGWGNVGAAAGYYLSRAGGLITGILDHRSGLIRDEGFTADDINSLFKSRSEGKMFGVYKASADAAEKFWSTGADVFIPAAASRLVQQDQLERLKLNGCKVISGGANVPFADSEIFFGPVSKYADEHFSAIPDFISNCGMARVFAYLMGNPEDTTAAAIFKDVSATIRNAMNDVKQINPGLTGFTSAAYDIALKKLL